MFIASNLYQVTVKCHVDANTYYKDAVLTNDVSDLNINKYCQFKMSIRASNRQQHIPMELFTIFHIMKMKNSMLRQLLYILF